jgi:hypothetical protein
MDKLQWFKFRPTDWMMGKIQRCPEITQARFIRLICLYWNKECLLTYDDAEIEIDKEHLDILISKKIIKIIDNYIVIDFLNEQLDSISETSKKRRDSVLKRWERVKQNDTNVLQVDTSVLQNDTDKSRVREEEIREEKKEKSFLLFWDLYEKKVDKVKTEKAFLKLSETEIDLILSVVKKYVDSTPDVKFRKNPLTWLNGKCWNDVVQTKKEEMQFSKNFQSPFKPIAL